MKNTQFQLLGRLQRQYHRSNPWRLSQAGLYVPHCYAETKPNSLSWWDDVGFILNRRRVIVWWQHPRHVYANALDDLAWQEAGDGPHDNWITEGSTKNYRRVGKSRKKVVSYTCRQPSVAQRAYYDRLEAIRERLATDGIDCDVTTSWKRERLAWATGVSLVAPLEVRNAAELNSVAILARRLVLGQTTLAAEFPAYCYGRADWIEEQALRDEAKASCVDGGVY